MASLISPRPLSHMQNSVLYNPYGRPGLMSYVDAQNAVVGAPLALTPDQSNLGPYGDGGAQAAANMAVHEEQKIYNLVIDLLEPVTREGALLELSKKREQFDELALVLWHSFGKHSSRTSSPVPSNWHQVSCPPYSRKLYRFTRCFRLPILRPMSPIVSVTRLPFSNA